MKILIVKTSSLGDIIQAFPVVEYLKKRYPTAEIDWVVEKEYEGLIRAHPDIRKAIALNTRAWRKRFFYWKEVGEFFKELRYEKYDLLFDLQGNTKSALITGFAKAAEKVGFGWSSAREFPNVFVTKRRIEVQDGIQVQLKYLQLVQRFFGDQEPFLPQGVELRCEEKLEVAPGLKVMVACGSRWPNKQLSEKTLKEVVLSLEFDAYYYFVWGSEEEKKEAEGLHRLLPERSSLLGNLSFPLWQAWMRKMDLVIAVDSAALALCGTTKTPSYSFFGPTRSEVYKPLGDHHVAWQGKCPYEVKFKARCPRLRSCKTGACIKSASLSAEQMPNRHLSL